MKSSSRAHEAPGSARGIRCLPDARPEPSYTQQATWYHRPMNQRLALWLQKEKEKEQDTLCWDSCPKWELCWCLLKLSLCMLASCPAWQLQEFCKKSEGEFPLRPWLRTRDQELCRQKRHYPSNIPSCLWGSRSSRQKAGQLAVQPWMEKMYSTGNQPVEFFLTESKCAEAFKNKDILILWYFKWIEIYRTTAMASDRKH